MNVGPLLAAIDAEPFQPFTIELQSGRLVPVHHPENIFFLPGRQRVDHIEVCLPETEGWVMFYPEALCAVLRNGAERTGRETTP